MMNNTMPSVSNFDPMGGKGKAAFSICEDVSIEQPGGMFNLNQSIHTIGTIGNSTVIEECRSTTASELHREKLESEAVGFMRAIKTVLIFILLATIAGLLVIK